jgi:hypothetical protein
MPRARRTGTRNEAEGIGPGRRRSPTRGNLYADDPVDAAQDRLDRGRLADQLTRSVVAVSEQSDSAVVAIVGPWGSGKSSLLLGIEERLRTGGWYLARHNPWMYSSYGSAAAGFFAEIRDAVPDEVMGPDRRKTLGEWVGRLAPAGALGSLGGVDATGLVTATAALIAGDRSPEGLRKNTAEALATLDQPVLVILDDLDRLQPDELLLTFKLVRLIGRLPNLYYLLAYDEETLSEVLQHTGLIGADPGRARQYLEKMVQVRLDIPPMLEDQGIGLVSQGIDGLCATHGIQLGPSDWERLGEAWSDCLVLYLDQPRAVKRLFTQVDARWPEVHREVDFVDFLLMTFLRTFERDVHDLVVRNRGELLGSSLIGIGKTEANGERWKRWKHLIGTQGKPRHVDAIAALLAMLFLFLRGARENTSYSSDFREDVRRRRGVDSDEFLDRYTQVGVPAGDLPDQLVRAAIAELRNGRAGPALGQLQTWFDKDAAKAVNKLARADEQEPLPAESTLALLGRNYLPAARQRSGFLVVSADRHILRAALRILDREGGAGLETLATSGPSGLALAADLLRKAKRDASTESNGWLADGIREVSAALEAHLRSASGQRLIETPNISRYAYAFWDLRGRESAHALLWELLESPAWELEDLLAALVPVGQASNGRRTWETLGELEAGNIDELLGLERVLAALPEASAVDADESDVSFENRRRYAMRTMQRLRTDHKARKE